MSPDKLWIIFCALESFEKKKALFIDALGLLTHLSIMATAYPEFPRLTNIPASIDPALAIMSLAFLVKRKIEWNLWFIHFRDWLGRRWRAVRDRDVNLKVNWGKRGTWRGTVFFNNSTARTRANLKSHAKRSRSRAEELQWVQRPGGNFLSIILAPSFFFFSVLFSFILSVQKVHYARDFACDCLALITGPFSWH